MQKWQSLSEEVIILLYMFFLNNLMIVLNM